MPPPTPLLAGIPTALTQSPAASYMPQKSWIRPKRSSAVAPGTSDTAAIAPALIIGFFGVLVMRSTLISLKASPDGSTPIFASTAASPIECNANA
jgi:hypothetical protein